MFKKFCSFLSFIVIVSLMASAAIAAPDAFYDKSTSSSDSQFLVKITRPDGNESTFKTSYVICGVTDQEDVSVELLIEKDGRYEEFATTDGYSSWDIGSSGVFMKEVMLPNKGANKIRIVAYKKAEYESLAAGKNLQISNFTITVLEEGIKDKIKNGFLRVSDMLKGIFK